MVNAAEELSYWYFRLNGFFPISNFVIHRSAGVNHSADEDILAIRTPYVYEPIGGQKEDWDTFLFQHFDEDALIGIVCQVKGGKKVGNDFFNEPYFGYCIDRLGLSHDKASLIHGLENVAVHSFENGLGHKCQIGKILISVSEKNNDAYLHLTLDHVRDFIKWRISKYMAEKSRDSHFFQSVVMQMLIKFTDHNF